uniref:Cleavage and polyadenylation specificity factor subunit 6 n=1 Tax=Angiostrongylus cantonensis TaxID=6313 RepID=A0A0K0CYP7_ANGCA
MGSAGIAIGPDGKPLKRQERRSHPARGFAKHGGRRGMGMAGRPMHGGPGPMMNPGFGRPGPFMEPYGPFPPGVRGPMPFAVPGRNIGFGEGNQNVSFFNGPQSMPGSMSYVVRSGQAATPCASTVGRGSVGCGSTGMASVLEVPYVTLGVFIRYRHLSTMSDKCTFVVVNCPFSVGSSEANNGVPSNTANEVPGFGTNSSIHELFGKMVWKKMEGLRDEAVIDRLQNRIMNMIHEALAQQSDTPASSNGGTNQSGAVNGRPTNSFSSF